jgi:predicted MFS family arabinose efflux permease
MSPPHHAGRAVGQVYLGISAALVLGVPLGTVAANSVGWRGSFAILAVLSMLLAVLVWRIMPSLPASPKAKPGQSQSATLWHPRFLLHVGLSVITFTAMFTAYTYLADFLEASAGIERAEVGWWLMGFGVVGLAGNWLGGVLADRSALLSTLAFVVLLTLAMVAIEPIAGNHGLLGLVLALWGISYTALFPICQIRVMKAGGQAQALAATVNVSAANAGAGIGAIVGGIVIEQWQVANLGYASAILAGLAALYALAMLILRRA